MLTIYIHRERGREREKEKKSICVHGNGGSHLDDFTVRIHNKPISVKTIKTEVGDVYNCVDIQKQPAIDHPLFKNHIVQMKPSFVPKEDISSSISSRDKYSSVRFITVNCPEGTVPIRKLSKQDLIRMKDFQKSSSPKVHPESPQEPGRHYAILRSRLPEERYHGVESSISLHNVTVAGDQSTSARMWIENDKGGLVVNSLQTGWMISPGLNGDGLTRLFALWELRMNGIYSRPCFNTICAPGFIQVNKDFPVDMVVVPGCDEIYATNFAVRLRIFQDNDTGHWWLHFQNNSDEPDSDSYTPIGYWAKDLVPNLAEGSSYFAWGGFATGPPHGISPPMGDSKPFDPRDDELSKRSFVERLKIYNESRLSNDPEPAQVQVYVDNQDCYGARNLGLIDREYYFSYFFLYGGNGGNCRP